MAIEIIRNEIDKLVAFRNQLEDIQGYLSEYDRHLGLAFFKNNPNDCAQKLIDFINERIDCLLED